MVRPKCLGPALVSGSGVDPVGAVQMASCQWLLRVQPRYDTFSRALYVKQFLHMSTLSMVMLVYIVLQPFYSTL